MISWYLKGDHGSLIHVVGSVLACLGLRIVPVDGLSGYWWVPLVVDIGGPGTVLVSVIWILWKRGDEAEGSDQE